MIYLTESDVRELLPMVDAIQLMHSVFERLADGEAANHPRRRLILPTGSVLHYMAGSDGQYFGAKIYSSHPRHGAHFLFLLYRAADAEPLALIEANHLGQIRTGAASGLATRFLAAEDASTVSILGSGFQAGTQLEAMLAVRKITDVRVWSRNPARRAGFAAEASVRFGMAIRAVETAEQAVRDAAIVVTATNAKEPVLNSEWVAAGAHINAMGSNQATRRELPADLVCRADWIVVDSKEQARMESGDLLMAFDDRDWASPKLVELQEIVSGRVHARTRTDEITLFKSNGLAVEDVIAAAFVYERAVAAGRGRAVASAHS
jgi:ornithine cyclodeaminase/alanine dehydrogenase-like protein (mu-crystallin family)